MAKLTILRGISGSGKSTWARSQVGAVVVSRDDLRVALFGGDGPEYYSIGKDALISRENYITTVEHAAIRNALKAGRDVISDNTNTMMKFVNKIAKIGWSVGAEVELKVFDVALGDALIRNANRAKMGGRNVPDEAIQRQHSQLQGSKNATLNPPPPVKPYTGTPGKPKAFMVDVDGTLAHMNGKRGPFEWHNVFRDDVDDVVADVVTFIYHGSNDMDIPLLPIVMSGRDESSRSLTSDWLLDHGIPFEDMFMRPEGDMRADNIVKAELFDTHVRDNYDVQFVLDDRWQVCEMWLTMGLKVFNVSGLDRGEF